MKFEVVINDVGENQCVASIESDSHQCYTTPPQVCSPDALRIIGKILQKMPVDVFYAIIHKTKLKVPQEKLG